MALTNAQYDELMRRYQQKQLQAHHNANLQKARIYEQIPALSQIDSDIASISVQKAKEYISGNTLALTDLDAQIKLLTEQKQQLLTSAGYEEDAFEPKYQCDRCKDTGFINNQKCHCFLQAELEYVYAQSNLKALLEKENFDAFSLSYYPEDLIDPVTQISSRQFAQSAFKKCKAFTEDFGTHSDNLFIYGNTGTGKTFLTNCIAGELLQRGYSVIYFSAFQLFDIFSKHAYDRTAEDNDYQNIFNCDLLIIDDLGTEVPNNFTVSKFFQCINERQLRQKSTVISTNLSLRDLTTIYSDRIASRINSNYTQIKMFGNDIRILKKLS